MFKILLPLLLLAPGIRVGSTGAVSITSGGNNGGVSIVNNSTTIAPPLLSFADATGVGMGTACACAAVTGTKGEALTFTRASVGYCTKGGVAATGIATGDLIPCALNTPRIATGANGLLGLLKEHQRINLAIQSAHPENAAWTLANAGSVNPTVTAAFANGPCGTPNGTTCFAATRVQFGACPTSGNISILFQTVLGGAGQNAASTYCMGTSVSQTFSVCAFDDGANAGTCVQVTCPASSWSRPFVSRSVASTTGGIVLGCNNGTNYIGSASTGTADVLLWNPQYESGAAATSPIVTTTTAATRSADLSQFLSETFPTNNTGSFAASVISNFALNDAEHGIVSQSSAGPAYGQLLDYVGGTPTLNVYFSAGAATNVGSIVIPFTAARVAGFWDHATQAVSIFNGVQGPVPLATPPITTTNAVEIGQYSGVAQLDGIINQVCVDSDPTRCR